MGSALADHYLGLALNARKVDIRLPRTRDSNSHGARPVYSNHLDDSEDSENWIVDKELSLSRTLYGRMK